MTAEQSDTELAAAIRRLGRATRTTTAARNHVIIEAHRRGWTLRRIAALAGLTNPAVLYITRKDTNHV